MTLRARPRTAGPLVALAVLAFAGCARAEVRLSLRAGASAVAFRDLVPVEVSVTNDEVARQAVVVASMTSQPKLTLVTMPISLAPGARKVVLLMVPAVAVGSEVKVTLLVDETPLAEGLVAVDVRRWRQQGLPACLGPCPPALAARILERDGEPAVEIDPERLPHDELAWPSIDVLVWPAPREGMAPALAVAIRRWVEGGGDLVVGVSPEEPSALERVGLGELAPARVARGEGISLRVEGLAAGAARIPGTALVLARRGFGSVTLAPLDLSARTGDAEAALTSLPEGAPGEGPTWRRWSPMDALQQAVGEHLTPRPPIGGALALLIMYSLVTIVDHALLRRSARLGRRARWKGLRHAATVAVAAAGAFAITEAATGVDECHRRVDRVDVLPGEGVARGWSVAAFARGDSGDVVLESGEASHVQAKWTSAEFNSPTHEQSIDGVHRRVRSRIGPWEVFSVRTAWRPLAGAAPLVTLEADGIHVPACAAAGLVSQGKARAAEGRVLAGPLVTTRRLTRGIDQSNMDRNNGEPAPISAPDLLAFGAHLSLHPTDREAWGKKKKRSPTRSSMPPTDAWPESEDIVLLVTEGSAGPSLTVDGRPLDTDVLTLWRIGVPRVEEPPR